MLKRILNLIFFANVLLYSSAVSQIQKQKVVPPSPAMATFNRFQYYPVSYSTGLPQISVPLYQVNLSGFSYPISIDFHASGRKTNMDFSSIGVGWSLTASGYISREIRERPDELFAPGMEVSKTDIYNTENGLYTPAELPYAKLLAADMAVPNQSTSYTKLDAEHDIFSFSLNGTSGKFIINDVGNIIPLTSTALKFEGSGGGGFVITDEKGVKYIFNANATSNERVSMQVDKQFQYVTTGWYLNRVETLNRESITFNYQARYTGGRTDLIESPFSSSTALTYGDQLKLGPFSENDPGISNFSQNLQGARINSTYGTRDYFICYLSSIEFTTGKVVFTYDDQTLKLTHVGISDLNNNSLKSFTLGYKQTPGTLGSLPNNNSSSLASLTLNDKNSLEVSKYIFDYYDNALTFSDNRFTFYSKSDWWGYSNNTGEKFPVNSASGPEVLGYGCTDCKVPNFSNKLSGMLRKITYPTGGNSEFIYESNKYSNNLEGPGLRIKQIITDDGSAINRVTKLYKYGQNEDGIGVLPFYPDPQDFVSQQVYENWYPVDVGCITCYGGSYRIRTYSTYPISELMEGYQQPVYYSKVTEYTQSSSGVNNGKIVYSYSIPGWEYSGEAPRSFRLKNWVGGKLTAKEVFKSGSAQNNYTPVSTNTYSYTTLNYLKIPQVRLQRNWSLPFNDDKYGRPEERNMVLNGSNNGPIYYLKDYPIESAVEVLEQENFITYDLNQKSLQNKTKYYYSNLIHLRPTKVETETSTNELLITENKYAGDFSGLQGQSEIALGIINLQEQHVFSPIETSIYKSALDHSNKRLLTSKLIAYNRFDAVPDSIMSVDTPNPLTNFSPASVQGGLFVKDSRYKNRVTFDSYDSNLNLLQQHIAGGTNDSYKWNSSNLPIVKVSNAKNPAQIYELGLKLTKYLPVSQLGNSVTFKTDITADISLAIGNISSSTEAVTVLTQLSSVGTKTLCVPYNGLGCGPDNPSYVTYANIPAGTYTLTVSSTTSVPATLDYTYIGSRPLPTGSEFYFEDFEERADGSVGPAHTGTHFFNGPTFSIAWERPNTRAYVYSYWSKVGGLWRYSGELPYLSNSLILAGANGYDDIRIYPKASEMTTYSYDPSVGMTSETDAKGMTMYYEYDDFQRLKTVRDYQGFIIRNYKCNFGSTVAAPITLYTNDVRTGTFIRNNCSSGQVGSSVVYTVPKDKYTAQSKAAANALAEAEIASQGQNYANANGSCSVPAGQLTISIRNDNSQQIDFMITMDGYSPTGERSVGGNSTNVLYTGLGPVNPSTLIMKVYPNGHLPSSAIAHGFWGTKRGVIDVTARTITFTGLNLTQTQSFDITLY